MAVTKVSAEHADLPGVRGVDLVTSEPVTDLKLGQYEHACVATTHN